MTVVETLMRLGAKPETIDAEIRALYLN
jgi:hypothetical protein